jgi:hypothetical protein
LRNGLRQFFETGSTAGLQAPLARKLRLQLAALHAANQIEDMDLSASMLPNAWAFQQQPCSDWWLAKAACRLMHCGCRGCWRCKTATTCGRPGSLLTCLGCRPWN